MREIISVSLGDEDTDVWERIMQVEKGDRSRFIKGLIRLAIQTEREGVDPRVAELVKEMLDSRLAGMTMAATNRGNEDEGREDVDPGMLVGVF